MGHRRLTDRGPGGQGRPTCRLEAAGRVHAACRAAGSTRAERGNPNRHRSPARGERAQPLEIPCNRARGGSAGSPLRGRPRAVHVEGGRRVDDEAVLRVGRLRRPLAPRPRARAEGGEGGRSGASSRPRSCRRLRSGREGDRE
eukprot:563543-Pyramimonas_sp.AAC.1